MVISFLKKMFGADAAPSGTEVRTPKAGEPDLEGFVTYVVRSLVDRPDEVVIKSTEHERNTTIQVACARPDIGKVIGKSGKTIAAIRALVNGAGGRIGKKVNVEILD